jgi:hypothetical protein
MMTEMPVSVYRQIDHSNGVAAPHSRSLVRSTHARDQDRPSSLVIARAMNALQLFTRSGHHPVAEADQRDLPS